MQVISAYSVRLCIRFVLTLVLACLSIIVVSPYISPELFDSIRFFVAAAASGVAALVVPNLAFNRKVS